MPRYRIVVERQSTELYELEAPSEKAALEQLEKDKPIPLRVGTTTQVVGVLLIPD